MKKLIFPAAIVLSSFAVKTADAQVSIGLHLNIGSQPDWGPVGYDHVSYYYLPDVDAYYDVPTHQYVYLEDNAWVHRAYLPARYRNYDVYNGYKVVVNRSNPWLKHSYYQRTYAGYRGRSGQPLIRDSRDVRYQNHWRGDNGNHNGWNKGPGNDWGHGNPGRGNGHGNGWGHGNGHGNGHGHH